MIWERLGRDLYAKQAGVTYRVLRTDLGWLLTSRWDEDTYWSAVGYYATERDAQEAARPGNEIERRGMA